MSFPSIVLENQFGEVSNNFVKGGSSQINCNFIVDVANGNGLGLRSLKGQGIKAVYMHTSSTPAAGNPNPAVGLILVEFEQAFLEYVNGTFGFVAPVSGTPVNISSGLTANAAYVITSVGTSTPANWQAIGLPANITPAVGVSFIASTASAGTGTGIVEAFATAGSTTDHIEVIGNPNMTLQPTDGTGGYMALVCLAATNSSTTTLKALAPADGTVVGLTFNMIPVAAPLI